MKKTRKNTNMGMAMGMCVGVSIGISLGIVFKNASLGTSLGLSIGLAVGLAIGSVKDKVVNEQIEKYGYTIRSIDKSGEDYRVVLVSNAGEKRLVEVTAGQIETEDFAIGDVVFLDDDGIIEQAFDKEDE